MLLSQEFPSYGKLVEEYTLKQEYESIIFGDDPNDVRIFPLPSPRKWDDK